MAIRNLIAGLVLFGALLFGCASGPLPGYLVETLPESLSSLRLFDLAKKENVVFVPGNAFYVDGGGNNTLRLNFSNSDEEKIEEGIKRLARVIKKLLMENK